MLNRPHRDLTGLTFARLTVLGLAGRDRRNNLTWRCQCSCGSPERIVVGSALVCGNTKSCGGCKRGAQDEKHGRTKTPEYHAWHDAKTRCFNPKSPSFVNYGGRGIMMCERWKHSFLAFLADMDERPSPHHSLDRYPDRNGNYEPTNCRWATWEQQLRNTRRNRVVIFHGREMCGSELAEISTVPGLLSTHVCARLALGWTPEEAISTPRGQRRAARKVLLPVPPPGAPRLRVRSRLIPPPPRLRVRAIPASHPVAV